MKQHRIILTRRFPAGVEALMGAEFDTLFNCGSLARDELLSRVATADALCPTVTDQIDADLIEHARGSVRIISNFGVGFNNIDVAAARDAGIIVTNTPDVLTECTADLAITLMLMIARRAAEGERLCRTAQWSGWEPQQLLGTRFSGKTLGLIGFGRIGQAVAQRARQGFGMQLLVLTPRPVEEATLDRYGVCQVETLAELLRASDFVSLHCPSTPATRHLIDAEALSLMQAHAILVNTARGDIVDEAALANALQHNLIGGAALDVYENEPRIHSDLIDLDNVVLLPHLGSATHETRQAMGMRVLKNLRAFFAGQEPPDRVS